MQRRTPLPANLRDLARRHGGVLTTAQLEQHNVTRSMRTRMVNDGTLFRPRGQAGLYALEPHLSLRGMGWAGIHLGGTGAAVGGWQSLALAGARIDNRRLGEAWQIWVPRDRYLSTKPPWVFRRDCHRRLAEADRLDSKDPWLIPAEHALLDVTGAMPRAQCLGLTLDLLRDGNLHPHRLQVLLHERRHRHRVDILEVITDHLAGVESLLEHRYIRDVEKKHGLASAQRQVHMRAGRCDVLYGDQRLVVELDGRAFHKDRFRDARRDNANLLDGYVTLRYGWHDVVTDPCLVAEQVATQLTARGWTGTPRRCPRCPQSATVPQPRQRW